MRNPMKAADKAKQKRPKAMPEGPSTMERIAQGGKPVKSIARRNRERKKGR